MQLNHINIQMNIQLVLICQILKNRCMTMLGLLF